MTELFQRGSLLAKGLLLAAAMLACAPVALPQSGSGQSFFYTGTFASDDDKRLFNFTLTAASTVTLRTYSYAGGHNSAGTLVAGGGFDPSLALFDSTGNTIAVNRDGGCTNVAADATTHFCWDSLIRISLPAGSYQLLLVQSDNLPVGNLVTDSLVYAGDGNFTAFPGVGTSFLDYSLNQRTGNYAVEINGVSAASTADLQITSANPATWVVGVPFTQTLAASGGEPGYLWGLAPVSGAVPASIDGLTLSQNGVLSGVPSVIGTYTFGAQVSDTLETVFTKSYTLQVNPPVVISGASPPNGTTGLSYSYTFQATGGATSAYTWSVVGGTLPPGLNLSTGGYLSGSPSTPGNYSFGVKADDGVLPAIGTAAISVLAPLTVTAAAPPSGTINVAYSATAITVNGGSGSFQVSATGLPGGLTMASNGVISGTPLSGGTFNVQVTVNDTVTGASQTATLSIVIGYQPLKITTSTVTGTGIGGIVSGNFGATGGKPPYTWSAAPPSGTVLDPVSGVLSGSPASAGNSTFTVTVTDSQPVSTNVTVTLPVLGITNAGALPGGTTTAAYQGQINAVGGTAPYSFSSPGLPAGLTISNSGAITGTATTAGTYSFQVSVRDSAGLTTTGGFSLNIIQPPPTVTVQSGALPDGQVNAPYSQNVQAVGGKAPYAWTLVGGTMPDGLSLSTAGTVSGTPTTPGSYTFSVQAQDSTGAKSTGAFTLKITAPALTFSGNAQLPSGIVGTDYPPQVLKVSGGTAPYTMTISKGTLPAGLAFADNTISGTPTASGNSAFTVTATDANGQTASAGLTLNVRPANADLVLSSSEVDFALATGATTLPNASNIPIRSSVVQQLLNYTIAVNPASPWMSATGGSTTPGAINVALTSQALTQSAGNYSANVVVTCVAPSPCAGNAQNITVTLAVTSPPPQLRVGTTLMTFSSSSSNPVPGSQSLSVSNSGGGTITVNSITASNPWLTISGVPATLKAGASASLTVTANPSGLSSGYYLSNIAISTSAGSASVAVGLTVAQDSTITLSPSGSQFSMPQGGAPGNASGAFQVTTVGATPVAWTASNLNNVNWLTLGNSAGNVTASSPGNISYSINSNAASLPVGSNYATIRVTANAPNSPQDYLVVLNVTAANVAPTVDPEPAGLVFITQVGATASPLQVTVFTTASSATGYQASASVNSGSTNWLSVSPASGSMSRSNPGVSTVSVSTSGLKQGVYTGGVSYAATGSAVRTVNVTLIVQPAGTSGTSSRSTTDLFRTSAASCSPTTLVPAQTGLVSNFSQPAAWPTPLVISLFDDCGNSITGGQVIATFSNGDPPLAMPATPGKGVYSATWTPRSVAQQVTITATANAPGFTASKTTITGQVLPNKAPVLNNGGVLHVFNPHVGGAVGPGNIIQIYGSNLAAQTNIAPSVPLPTTLTGTQVLIGGVPAPIYFVSTGQVNAQVPFELTPGQTYQVLISANGAYTTPQPLAVAADSPGIAAFASGQIIAQHQDGSLISEMSPAIPGEYVVFYLSGLGATDNPVASGQASPSSPLARPQVTPTLTLNGNPIPVAFAGLTPTAVALYQINFQIPADAAAGDQLLVVTQDGNASNQTILPIGTAPQQ